MQLFAHFCFPPHISNKNKPTVAKHYLCSPQPSKKNMFLFVAAGEETPRQEVFVPDSPNSPAFLKLGHI